MQQHKQKKKRLSFFRLSPFPTFRLNVRAAKQAKVKEIAAENESS